ncbi:uncharacterized protein LOC106416776 [Brassica napus]|uniref:uncharacterized protein LOC106416776 n=1 Tax=Brassica napus TaxID=3708 RepID=UPI002079017A|nr:uncharacterized protein LOC106416776 [Brassica napus]
MTLHLLHGSETEYVIVFVCLFSSIQTPTMRSSMRRSRLSNEFFSDLKSGRCSGVIEARLLQFWEARNVKRGGELMWVDMLLVDLNTRTHDVWYPKQKRLKNGAPIPNPHPAPASTPDEPTLSSNSRTYTVSRWKETSTTSTS